MAVRHFASCEGNCWQEEGVLYEMPNTADTLELTGEKKQEILGFGGCFNELGWEALQLTPPETRNAFLDELFLEENCNFNYGRIPIGANDFSLQWYSCDETQDDYELKDFTIDRDRKYTIPFIREAQKRQDNFWLFASPWSPPTWMKTHQAYNYGRIRMEEKVLKAYADYFVRFVQEYAGENIPISQIHVQNEPMADQKFPSCLWEGEDMRIFIRDYLGPAMKEAGIDAKLWLGTINGPFYDYQGITTPISVSEFFDPFANTVLSDPKAREYIYGVGFQWGGKHMIEQVMSAYPEMHVMQTESECGDGLNTWQQMEYIFHQMWFYFRHGAERYTYWNLALKEGGISTWGWRQNALCTVDPSTGELRLQPEFYLMKHFSYFVKKGARLLETKGHWTSNTVAFENKDGSVVLVVENGMNKDREFSFTCGGTQFSAEIAAHSLHTFVIEQE